MPGMKNNLHFQFCELRLVWILRPSRDLFCTFFVNFGTFLGTISNIIFCFRWHGTKVELHFRFCALRLVWIGLKEFELFMLVMIQLTKMLFWPWKVIIFHLGNLKKNDSSCFDEKNRASINFRYIIQLPVRKSTSSALIKLLKWRQVMFFSNFSCLFLTPNYFFQFEF